jgi:Helicase conserved C-terminal domain
MEYQKIKNNTSFPFAVKKLLSGVEKDNILQYHQKVVLDFVMAYSNLRGLLIYHQLGSGKTILAITVCEMLQKRFPKYKKIFLVQRSLRENVISNMQKINVDCHDYTFISSNANNLMEQINRKFFDLENTILVVDEAHNLFNAILNGSKNAIDLYRKVMDTRQIKIFFLSGTVIINDPAELGVCFNMLNGYFRQNLTLFPEYYDTFHDYFIKTNDNDDKFLARVYGLVSYHSSKKEMPEQKPLVVKYVPMTKYQYAAYSLEKKLEDASSTVFSQSKTKMPLIKKNAATSSYRIKTRQLCNIVYPDYAYDEVVNVFNQKRQTRNCKKLLPEFYSDASIAKHAPKFKAALSIIESYPDQKGYIYSQFLDSGVLPFAEYLKTKGFSEFNIDGQPKKNTFCIITGDVDNDLRGRYIDVINSNQNINGQIIKIVLISAAVSQGISLFGMRYVIIFESYWNWTRINQIIGRGLRYDSHLLLPAKERNLTPYIMIAQCEKKEVSTDEDLYKNSIESQVHIEKFLTLLKRASIDCLETDCFMCKPTNSPLYLENVNVDINTPTFCEKFVTQEISVKQITHNGVKYYYNFDEGKKVHIYKWDDFLSSYKEIYVSDKVFKDLYNIIKNL